MDEKEPDCHLHWDDEVCPLCVSLEDWLPLRKKNKDEQKEQRSLRVDSHPPNTGPPRD